MGPAETIAKLKTDRATWSPSQILDELAAQPALPDEYDPSWQEDEAWDQAYKLIALAELVAQHRVPEGIGMVLDRMAYGDPGQTMRGIRLAFEAAVTPDWWRLAEICLSRCSSPRAGTRYWAVDELGVIRDPASVPAMIELLDDPAHEVAVAACRALMMISQTHDDIRPTVVTALRSLAERHAELAAEVAADLEQMEAAESPSKPPPATKAKAAKPKPTNAAKPKPVKNPKAANKPKLAAKPARAGKKPSGRKPAGKTSASKKPGGKKPGGKKPGGKKPGGKKPGGKKPGGKKPGGK